SRLQNKSPKLPGRAIPNAVDMVYHMVCDGVDLVSRRIAAPAESDALPSFGGAQAQRQKHVAWLYRSRRARGAGRHANALEIERAEKHFRRNSRKSQVRSIGQPWSARPGDGHALERGFDLRFEAIAQRLDSRHRIGSEPLGAGPAKAGDADHV